MDGGFKFAGLINRLFGPRHDYREGLYTFEKLDIPRCKRELSLEKSGDQNGRSNTPAIETQGYDGVEQRVDNFISAKRDEAVERANHELVTLAERLAATSLEGRAVDLKVEVANRIANFRATIANGENKLHLARQRVLAAQENLNHFKETHRLRRPAHYPSSHIFAVAIIGIIIGIEGILNGVFLGDAQPNGIAGGIVLAVMISVVNVLLGFTLGRFLGLIAHRRWMLRIGAVLVALALLAVLILVNLGAAHYRATLLAGNYRTTATAALQAMLSRPFGVGDLESWLLFLVGWISSSIAAREGLEFDDRYPGYGRVDRIYQTAVHDYDDEMRDVLQDIDDIKDEAVERAQALKADIDVRKGQRNRVLASRQRIVQSFNEHMLHLAGALRELMQTYRDANLRTRTTAPPPHFSQIPRFKASSLTVPEDLEASKSDSEYKQITDTLDQMVQELLEEHAVALRRFKSIETLGVEELARVSRQATPVAA